jgi:hypothetical protein
VYRLATEKTQRSWGPANRANRAGDGFGYRRKRLRTCSSLMPLRFDDAVEWLRARFLTAMHATSLSIDAVATRIEADDSSSKSTSPQVQSVSLR